MGIFSLAYVEIHIHSLPCAKKLSRLWTGAVCLLLSADIWGMLRILILGALTHALTCQLHSTGKTVLKQYKFSNDLP